MKFGVRRSKPRLVLGTTVGGFPLAPPTLYLSPAEIATHKHIIGTTGVGKSKLLESMFLQYLHQGIAVSFIDPIGNCANAILWQLISEGFFRDEEIACKRLLYVEFRETDCFLPLNVLKQPRLTPQTLASNVVEAFHRVWPALGDGSAPRFDNLMKNGTQVLIANKLPITVMTRLLTNKPYRDSLLRQVPNRDVVEFFEDRYDQWGKREAPQMIESTLSRVFLMTDSNVLKYSLGQSENSLDFRKIIDNGMCVIYNLGGIHDEEAKRLMGCLLSIGYEAAAKSRTDIVSQDLRRQHQLLLDEFHSISAHSEQAFSTMLSTTRQQEMFLTMAHQTFSQATAGMRGALQNVGARIVFRVGHDDAEYLSQMMGFVDPTRIKADPLMTDDGHQRSQAVYLELQGQWSEWTKALEDMKSRQAYVKISGVSKSFHINMIRMQGTKIDESRLNKVKQMYWDQLMTKQSEVERQLAALRAIGVDSANTNVRKSALDWDS